MSITEQHGSPADNSTEMEAGRRLQQLRVEQGLSIETVAEATKVSPSNLRAIEEQRFDLLPADTFVRGQVALYANFLGADGNTLARTFLEERDRSQPQVQRRVRKPFVERSLAPKTLAEPADISSATVAGLLLLAIVISVTAFCVYTSWNPFAFITDTTDDIQSAMIGVLQNEEDKSEVTLRAAESDTARDVLTVHCTKDTWIDVIIGDQKTVRYTLQQGESKTLPIENTLTVIFAKPDSATISRNGTPLPFPSPENGLPTLHLSPDQPEQ